MAEHAANDCLLSEDPAAFQAIMLAQLPMSKCCLCGEIFRAATKAPTRRVPSHAQLEGMACNACNGLIVLPQLFCKWAK